MVSCVTLGSLPSQAGLFVNGNDENCFQGVRKRKGLEQKIKDTGAWRVNASGSQTVAPGPSGGP